MSAVTQETLAQYVNRAGAGTLVQLQYDALLASHLKCRDKLLEIARECSECGGTGCVTVPPSLESAFGKVLPCPECEDLRDVLS